MARGSLAINEVTIPGGSNRFRKGSNQGSNLFVEKKYFGGDQTRDALLNRWLSQVKKKHARPVSCGSLAKSGQMDSVARHGRWNWNRSTIAASQFLHKPVSGSEKLLFSATRLGMGEKPLRKKKEAQTRTTWVRERTIYIYMCMFRFCCTIPQPIV